MNFWFRIGLAAAIAVVAKVVEALTDSSAKRDKNEDDRLRK
jgi:hypothetical protein